MTWRGDPFEGLIGDRKSAKWYDESAEPALQKLTAGHGLADSFYGYMFLQDVSQLLPFRSGLREGFEAVIQPEDSHLQARIAQSLPSEYGRSSDLSDAIRSFTTRCAFDLVAGPVTLEVELFRDSEGAVSDAFKIHIVRQGSLGRRRSGPIQYVPANRSALVQKGLHYVELDRERIVGFDLPRAQRVALNRSIHALRLLDRQQGVPTDMLIAGTPGFSFEEHQAKIASFGRNHTRAIGWDGRGLLSQDMLEPYTVWRRLQFAKFKLHLLDAVTGGLNAALKVAGLALKFDTKVIITGTMIRSDYEQAERDLASGNRKVSEISRMAYGLPPE